MKHSLFLAGILGASLVLPHAAFAEEAAAVAEAAPESPHAVSYNVGLYSQYIWRGMTQTDESPALQGGVDYSHASGFYAGAWASNVSWITDGGYYDSGSLEVDIYAGFANEFGDTGIGYNVGVLQYVYPGTQASGAPDANATEVYAGLKYQWLSGKYSYTVSDEAWGFNNADGSWYLEAAADIPVADTGLTANLHVGRFEFDGSGNSAADYTDWKVGLTKSWDNGINVGAYYTDNDADTSAGWPKEMADGQFVAFVQKTF